MKKIGSWLKEHFWLLKLLFITSIMFFVINQLTNILHGMTWHKFAKLMMEQGLLSILMMALGGCLAATPMILYDVALTKVLQRPLAKEALWRSGWIINTINNLVGFGGLVGVTLRVNRYVGDTDRRHGTATVTKTAIFMLTGLSMLCGVMFFVVLFVPIAQVYRHYQWWLLGGGLFAPVLAILIARYRSLFREFSWSNIRLFYLASFGQWTSALVIFLFIGYQIYGPIHLLQIAPLFVVSTLLGMLTMVPGGMGTFDVLMILGLNSIGISKEVAVLWILFYRIFYYIVPFISGMVLFVRETGSRLNKALSNLPSQCFSSLSHRFLSFILYLSGILMIILSTVPHLSAVNRLASHLFPFSLHFFDQALNMMIGLLLIGLARGVYDKVTKAYRATLLVLVFCFLNTISATRSWQLMLFFALTFVLTYLARKQFYRVRFVYSWSALLLDGTIFLVILIFYGVIGYFSNTSVKGPSLKFWLFPSSEIWFQGLAGLIIACFILFALYHYLSSEEVFGLAYDEVRFTSLAQHYGCNRYQQRGYSGKYRYYYYQKEGKDCVVLTFFIRANRCILLSDPLGPEAEWTAAIEEFMSVADQNDYQVVVTFASERLSLQLHDLGFRFMKIGEEGYRKVESCRQSATPLRPLTAQEYKEQKPQLEALANAQDQGVLWAPAKVDTKLWAHSHILVCSENKEGAGFISLAESPHTLSVLTLCYTGEVSVAKTLLVGAESFARKKGKSLSLSLSPLSNVGTSRFSFVEEKLIYIAYHFGESMTNFEEQRQVLEPFVDEWENRYLCYNSHQAFIFILFQCFYGLWKT